MHGGGPLGALVGIGVGILVYPIIESLDPKSKYHIDPSSTLDDYAQAMSDPLGSLARAVTSKPIFQQIFPGDLTTNNVTNINVSDVNWNVNDNKKHHISNGSNGNPHNWNKMDITPNDPSSWEKILILLQSALRNPDRIEEKIRSGKNTMTYFKQISCDAEVWTRITEFAENMWTLTDGGINLIK